MGNVQVWENVGELALQLTQSFFSFAGMIASGGITAPFALTSLFSTALSMTALIEDPTGDIHKYQKDALNWLSDTIKMPNAGTHIVNLVNQAGASVGADPIVGFTNASKMASDTDNQHKALARATGLDAMASPSSIMAINDPATKFARMSTGNAHDNAKYNVIRLSQNNRIMS